MAIKSFRTAVNPATYTKVGDNVTVFSVTEELVRKMRSVVTDVGDAAPDAAEVNYIPWDEFYTRSGLAAADVWVLSPEGDGFVYGESE